MYHLGARYYDPNIGRFTQPDPSGQEKNPYLYAEGDPVNRIDPNGLLSIGGVVDGITKATSIPNDLATIGKIGSAIGDGEYGKAAGIGFGLALSKAAEGACIAGGAMLGGPVAATAVAIPCMVGAEALGSFAEESTVSAWS